jgi:hypothetical protein
MPFLCLTQGLKDSWTQGPRMIRKRHFFKMRGIIGPGP